MRLKLVCLKRIEDILSAIGLPILYIYIYGINYAFMKENFHKTFLTTCEAAFSLFKMNR